MRYIFVKRSDLYQNCYIGICTVLDEGHNIVFRGNTLELNYKGNQRNISAIPKGVYKGKRYLSPTKGCCILLEDVPVRDFIEIHIGNYLRDTEGCILVGRNYKYDSAQKEPFLISSKTALTMIMQNESKFMIVIH